MVMTYVYGTEEMFEKYRGADPDRRSIPRLSWPKARHWGVLLVLAALAYGLKALAAYWYGRPLDWRPPVYMWFLMLVGMLPAAYVLERVYRFLNWRAYAAGYLALLLVSLLWEATLGIPYGYWGYDPKFMIGISVRPWSNLPIEAAVMWLIAEFTVVLAYEYLTIRKELVLAPESG